MDRQQRKQFYEGELLRAAPRLLSRLDRCPESASRGSMDREYWAWATKDFANMDMQRGLLVLAYLYKTSFKGNFYCGGKALARWIEMGIGYWIAGQSRQGAFDHLYPYENSWMATAFTLIDLAETYALMKDVLEAGLEKGFVAAMRRAGDFLSTRDEGHGFISNHRAGAAAALLKLASITEEKRYADRAWELMQGVYGRQSQEGWFVEYEGADPGYQTLHTHYQALFYRESGGDEKVLKRVAGSLQFISYFMHPDGSIGGEYGSRGCPHYFPGGFEAFAHRLPLAEALASLGADGLAAGTSSGLADADGRNEVPLATSYVAAHRALCADAEVECAQLPFEREFERLWPEAGMYVCSDAERYVVFGASKGGVVKVFDKKSRRLVFSSCGYAGRTEGGKHITTLMWAAPPSICGNWPEPGAERPLQDGRGIGVEAPFYEFIPARLMSPLKLILFRIFNISLGRSQMINGFVRRRLIVGRYIKRREKVGAMLRREFRREGSNIEIVDDIVLSPGTKITGLREHGFFSTVYMASARYFRMQDMGHAWSSGELAGRVVSDSLRRERKIESGADRQ